MRLNRWRVGVVWGRGRGGREVSCGVGWWVGGGEGVGRWVGG